MQVDECRKVSPFNMNRFHFAALSKNFLGTKARGNITQIAVISI